MGFIFNYLIGDFHYTTFGKLLLQIFWGDPIIEGHPSGRALWFIRNLIVFALMSPLYYYVVKALKHFTLILVFISAISSLGPQFDFPFYNAFLLFGTYLSVYGISFEKIYQKAGLVIPACLIVAIIITDICTRWFTYPGLIVTSIFFVAIYGICSRIRILPALVANTTFIYLTHMYVTSILRKALIFVLPNNLAFEIIAYILTFILSVTICTGLGYFLRKYTPELYGIMVGRRNV